MPSIHTCPFHKQGYLPAIHSYFEGWQLIEISLEIEELESKIAPDQAPGLLGYEGQPGNQGGK